MTHAARTARTRAAGAARLGDVRLGELGVPDDHHRRRLPDLLPSVVAADLPEAVATSRFAWATTIAIIIVALVAPLLGAIADYAGDEEAAARRLPRHRRRRRRLAMYWIERGDWLLALVLFVIGNIGVAGSIVFYESLLPHLVGEHELDRVSSAGYAIGYLGGGVLLAINLLMIQKPALVRASGGRRRRGPAVAGQRRRLVAGVLDSALPERAGAGARLEPDEQPGGNAFAIGVAPAGRDVPRAAPLPAGVPDAAGVPRLQRRHPDDHPDGDDLRQRDRHRRERDDHGAADHAVHRRAVRVPVRRARRHDRRQARGVRRPRRSTRVITLLGYFMRRRRTSSCSRSSSAWSRAARRRSAGRCSPA